MITGQCHRPQNARTREVACPTCHALIGQHCLSRKGLVMHTFHAIRWKLARMKAAEEATRGNN